MNKFRLLLIGISALLLVACSEVENENVEAVSNDEEIINTSIETSDISSDEEKANEIIMTYYAYVSEAHLPIYNNEYTDSTKQKYVNLTTEFLNYINGIDPYELDIQDKVLEEYLWDLDYSATMYAENTLDFLTSEDRVYADIAKDFYSKALSEMRLVDSVLK